MNKEDVSRFWSLVQAGQEDECWPFVGKIQGSYGVFRIWGKWRKAHRIAYELTYGPIGNEVIAKRCHDLLCCNPKHMRLRDDFWSNVDKQGEDDCWNWTGPTVGRYGMVCGGPHKGSPAHRVAWELTNGPLKKCILRRVCQNDLCCNSKHMVVEETDYWSKVDVRGPDECWPWTAHTNAFGYGKYRVGKKLVMAHRMAYELANGPIPEGMFLLHSCDFPGCQNPSHLSIGTKGDNNRDRTAKGRSARGEGHHCAVLTEDDVRFIRSSPLPPREIKKMLGVNESTVHAIRSRRTWKHVQ